MTWFPWELRVASDRTTILMPRNYSARRIEEVIRQYKVTHVLWGSFEPPPTRRSGIVGPVPRPDPHGARADVGPRAVSLAPRDALSGPAVSPSLRVP